MKMPRVLMTLCLGINLWMGCHTVPQVAEASNPDKETFQQHCTACHGPTAKGDDDMTFNPPVITLTSAKVYTQLQSAEGLEADSKTHRVVMHLNSGEEKVQKGTLNNIKNLYEAMGAERMNVELVAHGAGLSLFIKQDTKLTEELEKLKASYGVSYTACSNTMKAQGLTRADLIDQVDRIMPAMVRLMELQEQGWAYIKP